MPKNTVPLADWELILPSAAQLQRILPDAVLVAGTASAIHAKHRFSRDADHVLIDLRHRFDEVLAQLESVAGWKTARMQRPVQILGRYSSCKCNLPMCCPTIWKTLNSASTKISIHAGTTGERLKRLAHILPPRSSIGYAI
jgi:hypothetical protein